MEYTLAALWLFDTFGPRIAVPGHPPVLALVLRVDWKWTSIVLAGIPLSQLLLLCIVAYTSAAAVIKDNSYLAAAQLLKPVVEKLGPHGCILSGKEIARELGNLPIAYGVRCVPATSFDEPLYHTDVIPASECIESGVSSVWKPGIRMPKGWYDGTG